MEPNMESVPVDVDAPSPAATANQWTSKRRREMGVFLSDEELERFRDEAEELMGIDAEVRTRLIDESMVGTGRSWNDVDSLLTGLRDPEGRASAAAYLERLKARRR